jgi:hypothetical protein
VKHTHISDVMLPGKLWINLSCHSIYANSGTWADSDGDNPQPCTYVEVEENRAQRRHYVRVWAYTSPREKELLHEEYVKYHPK